MSHHLHTHRGSSNESFTPSTWSWSSVRSLHLILPFYFLHFLTHIFFFLHHLKFVDNLCTPPNESMDSADEFSLSTGYEPNAYDFNVTSVEPYMQLLDSPPLFSDKVSSADPDYGDAVLEDMLHQAHRAQGYHSLRENLSVTLSSSSMSHTTGRPVGDRRRRPVEQRNQEAQIRTLLDKQKNKFLQSAKQELTNTNFIALEPKNFNNEINSFFKDNYCSKIWNYVKLIREVSPKWKNYGDFRVLHSTLLQDENWSRIRTLYWHFLAEYRNCKNEINCMNDSKDFQDAESSSQWKLPRYQSTSVIPTSSDT